MKRNGKTSAGKVRWRCKSCNASKTHKIDAQAKHLSEFLDWLFSRQSQKEMTGGGRSFRRRTSHFWRLWPLPPLIDEIHRVVYVDGIYLSRSTVILIARSDDYVLGWYVAKSENSRAWRALISRIAPPAVVVTDGGAGFEKARKVVWPHTRVQRCTFHVFCQVKRYTTRRSKTQAGQELYKLALELLRVDEIEKAIAWLKKFNQWCLKYDDFLKELNWIDGKAVIAHQRLVKARNSLRNLIKKNTLFTYLDPELTKLGSLPATNNKIEGGVNAQIKSMLRDHRGLSKLRRIKAVFWWCYMNSEYKQTPAEMLRLMPTDDDVDELFRDAEERYEWRRSLPGLGTAIDWGELRLSGPARLEWM